MPCLARHRSPADRSHEVCGWEEGYSRPMTVDHIDLDLPTADRLLALCDPTLRAAAVAELAGGDNSAVFEVRTDDGRALVVVLTAASTLPVIGPGSSGHGGIVPRPSARVP